MAYFLKKSKLKKGVYLQIYESFYNPEKKGSSHKSFQSLGYVHELMTKGIDDPIAYYKDYVSKLNDERKKKINEEKEKKIGVSPEKYIGYFPIKNLFDKLNLSAYFNLLQINRDFKFDTLELLKALTYARIIMPCSKLKTYNDVFHRLYENVDISLNQVYSGIQFLGREYEKIIEILNYRINELYPIQTDTTFFDCTNFYFEIDQEDEFRKKGPSKELKKDPIVGMGLLLDANQIPIGMKMFPGNESEKPVIRDIISDLKSRNNIKGRTVQVADKGLNCAKNIHNALKNGDGYLFSKSVKSLPQKEITWVLLEDGFTEVLDKNKKALYKYKSCVDDFPYSYLDEENKKHKFTITEKRVVTYNPSLAKKQREEINKMVNKARNLVTSRAKKNEFGDLSKYVNFKSTDEEGKETDHKVAVSMNQKLIDKHLKLAGYNLLVTSEIKTEAKDIYSIYHGLWRIEESFRIMKSDLDARPVYLQNHDSIIGHFLVCYVSVLLLRLLQIKVLKERYTYGELIDFMRKFKVIQMSPRKFINITDSTETIKNLSEDFNLPLRSYFLSSAQIKEMMLNQI